MFNCSVFDRVLLQHVVRRLHVLMRRRHYAACARIAKGFVCVCGVITSWQHLRSYQVRYQLPTVRTHFWLYNTASLGNQATGILTRYLTQSHYPDTQLNQSLPYPNNAECQARKRCVGSLVFQWGSTIKVAISVHCHNPS